MLTYNMCNGREDTHRAVRLHLDHGVYVTLRTSELSRIFHLDENDEEQIVPHIVLVFAMLLKRHGLVVKCRPLKTCQSTHTPSRHVTSVVLFRRSRPVNLPTHRHVISHLLFCSAAQDLSINTHTATSCHICCSVPPLKTCQSTHTPPRPITSGLFRFPSHKKHR